MNRNVQASAIYLRNDLKHIGISRNQTLYQACVMVGSLRVFRTAREVSSAGHDEAAGFSRCREIDRTIIHMNTRCSYVHQTPDGLRRFKLRTRNRNLKRETDSDYDENHTSDIKCQISS